MQSLITELTKENKELLEKNRNYELKINSLLQTNKEILIFFIPYYKIDIYLLNIINKRIKF